MASILLIEDDQRIRQALAKRLAERGHDVESTATAMDGVQRAVSGTVDVVVLDLGLPDVDGAFSLRQERQMDRAGIKPASMVERKCSAKTHPLRVRNDLRRYH